MLNNQSDDNKFSNDRQKSHFSKNNHLLEEDCAESDSGRVEEEKVP
jgi:hypothetical protein